MTKKSIPPPFYLVVWHDAEDAKQTWMVECEAKEFGERSCEVISFGYLLSRTKQYVVLAADWIRKSEGEEAQYGRVTKIPTPWVKTVRIHNGRKQRAR